MRLQNSFITLVLILSFVAGYVFTISTWDGQKTTRVYVQGRVVASAKRPVRKPLLIDEILLTQENIIESLTVVKDSANGFIGLKFGNHITEYGQLLCSTYSQVEVILYGEGIATSGNPPRMIFSGECPKSVLGEIENPTLQVQQIFPLFLIEDCESNQKVPAQYELTNGTFITTSNLDFPISEPTWLLEKISFINETNPVNSIEFNTQQIKKILKSYKNNNLNFIEIPCE